MTRTEAFSVARTMQVLEVLAFHTVSAPQVAGALDIDPRTARSVLNRLATEGWATRSQGRRRVYRPSLRIVALASHVAHRDPLPRQARRLVARLHELTGARAYLAIPSYHAVLCLAWAGDERLPPRPWEPLPCHCTAAGKVLLAHRDAWRESVLSRPLERCTARTVVDRAAIVAEAAATRARGYAIEDGELEAGLRGAAVPVALADGEVFAALGIASADRDPDEEAIEAAWRCAAELEQALAAEDGRD